MARPSSYKKEYCEKIVEYFSIEPYEEKTVTVKGKDGPYEMPQIVANDTPLFAGFAISIGVSRETLHAWKRAHPEFADAYKKAEALQEKFMVTNGMKGLTQPAFTIFAAKNMLRWTDKLESKNENMNTNITFTEVETKDEENGDI